jgi:hypothetical protein
VKNFSILLIVAFSLFAGLAHAQDMLDPPDYGDMDHVDDRIDDRITDPGYPGDLVAYDPDKSSDSDKNSDSTPRTGTGDSASGGSADTCAKWTEPVETNRTNSAEECEDGKCRTCYTSVVKKYCIVYKGGEELIDEGHTRTETLDTCTDWESLCDYDYVSSDSKEEKNDDFCRVCEESLFVMTCKNGTVIEDDTKTELVCGEWYECSGNSAVDYESKYADDAKSSESSGDFLSENAMLIIGVVIFVLVVVVFFVFQSQKQ